MQHATNSYAVRTHSIFINHEQFSKLLTTVELVEIRRRSDSRDMRAVLREVMRLRAIISRADQLERSLGPTGGAVGMIREVLREELDEEPSIAELTWNDINVR